MFGQIGESSVQSQAPPIVDKWGTMGSCPKKKKLLNMLDTLDDYRLGDNFVNSSFNTLKNMEEVKGKDLRFT